ncbi:MAG: peptidylprolyl isomerase [Armatimonadetes bacterium]|nr:peptidylprolyl isomerase [Armatimonadota bacterium]
MPKDGDPIAIITTDLGRIVVRFFPEKAPNHVANFLNLADSGFYNGTKFHRVIKGFMIQGGDPNSKSDDKDTWGMGGSGHNVKAEFTDMPHVRGVLSMARSQNPDSASSQFFIMHQATPQLNGQYSVFGQVIEGIDVVDKIVSVPTGDRDRPNQDVDMKIEVKKWPVKLK